MKDVQVAFDTEDPNAQAAFWAEVLDYRIEDNSAFIDSLVEGGRMPADARIVLGGRSAFRDVAACFDPAKERPRFYFQRVPEGKTAKNRMHVDIAVEGEEAKAAEVQRLVALGATLLWETNDRGPYTYTLADPEGNEFCLH